MSEPNATENSPAQIDVAIAQADEPIVTRKIVELGAFLCSLTGEENETWQTECSKSKKEASGETFYRVVMKYYRDDGTSKQRVIEALSDGNDSLIGIWAP